MQKTTRLGLNKPDLNDYVNVSDLNENMDVLDEAVGDLQDGTAVIPELETNNKTLAGGINENKNNLTAHLADYVQFKESKGKPNGIAELDANGKLPDIYSGGVSAAVKDRLKLEILDESFYVQYQNDIVTTMVLDSSGRFVYIFLYNLKNKYYIFKYDVNTRAQVARSSVSYIARSHGVVQNATHLFVPVGTGSTTNRNQLAKINKETMVVEKVVSIGNDYGSIIYYNDLLYVSWYGGNIKVFSPVDLSVVKQSKPFDTTKGVSDTHIDITPNGRMFGFMKLYDSRKVYEIDIETLTTLATSTVATDVQWLSSQDNNFVFFVYKDNNLNQNDWTYSIGRLNIGNGQFNQESSYRFLPYSEKTNIVFIHADENYLFLATDNNNKLLKINKDTGVKLFDNDFTNVKDLTKGPDGKFYFMKSNTIYRTLY